MKRTIHIILILLTFAVPAISYGQITSLEKYADTHNSTYIFMSERMLRMAAKYGQTNAGEMDFGDMIQKLTCVQVIVVHNAATIESLITDINNIADKEHYPLLMSTSDGAEKIRIYFKEAKSKKRKASVIILKQSDIMSTVIGIEGRFTADDIGKLIK